MSKYRCKLCGSEFPNKRDALYHSCFEKQIVNIKTEKTLAESW